MRRFDPEYVALKDLIVAGGLGNPLMVHCIHRNPAVADHFTSEFMMRDSVVHEVDAVRFLLDEEIASVQVIKGAATRIAEGTDDPMLVIFKTESGRLVTDEIYVRTQVAYEVRTEAVGERGSAFIGLDQNLQVKTTDGRWGGQLTPSFVERFGAAYQTELQCWVDAKAGTIDGPGAWDGFAAVAVCEAGVQAIHTGEGAGATRRREPATRPPPAHQSRRRRAGAGHHRTGPDRRPTLKLALDPQMFYSTSSVHELPDIVAGLDTSGWNCRPRPTSSCSSGTPGSTTPGSGSSRRSRVTLGWASRRCCRCCAGRDRTRINGRRLYGPGSGSSRSPSIWAWRYSTPSSAAGQRHPRPPRPVPQVDGRAAADLRA